MNKYDFVASIIEEIDNIDISSIVKLELPELRQVGNNHVTRCPFHNEATVGAFSVNDERGIFNCFSCGTGGDGISFISRIRGIRWIEAVFEIALAFYIITQEDYDEFFSGRRYFKKDVSELKKISGKSKKRKKKKILDIEIRSKVYNMFLDILKLSEEHNEYLRTERGLNQDVIEERKYRTYPTPSAMKRLIEKMEEENMNVDEVLSHTAGFFQKEIKGEWVWEFPFNRGILMPIRDYKGRIEAIQIRRDKKDESRGRYVWLSSTFANNKDNTKNGTSSGSPLDVLYPEGCNPNIETDTKLPNQVLFITEGRFKSEIIAKEFKSTCISVQGVTNWKGIDEAIRNIEKQLKVKKNANGECFKGFKYIYVAFDSDMSYKYPVYFQLKNMTDSIEKELPELEIFYIHWDGEKGYKGIDDLLFNYDFTVNNKFDYRVLFNKIEKNHWDVEYEKEVEIIKKRRGVDNPMLLDSKDLKRIIIGEKETMDISK